MEYDGNGGINRTPVPVLRYSAEGDPMDTLLVLPGDEGLMIPSRSGMGWGSEVFAPTGEWLGAVVTPARFIVHEIGPEYVLGVWLDELDVEHVQVLRVVRSRAA